MLLVKVAVHSNASLPVPVVSSVCIVTASAKSVMFYLAFFVSSFVCLL